MKLNQFAIYRVNQQTEGKALWHLPYQEAIRQKISVRVEYYRQVSIEKMQEDEKVTDIIKRMKKELEVSDVLVINHDGEISCYYIDENYPQYLAGFIRMNTSGTLITMDTDNYHIEGKKGNWIASDSIIIDGKQFYLMEHQQYRNQAAGVILDAYGRLIVEECLKGFDEETKQKIHEYIQQNLPQNTEQKMEQRREQRLEYYQKFYQNGMYERSRESGTEANYDMVDGLVNNQKNPEKVSDTHMNKKHSQNQRDHVPKKRRSVIKRLREKQIAIAVKSGRPIPKYLDQEMERHK